jgi:hypothetical protein
VTDQNEPQPVTTNADGEQLVSWKQGYPCACGATYDTAAKAAECCSTGQ